MRLSGTLHVRGFGIRHACWLERRGHPWNVLAAAVYGSTRSGCKAQRHPTDVSLHQHRIRRSAQVASLRAARQPPGFTPPPTSQSPDCSCYMCCLLPERHTTPR
jgi:hypothetical protein